MQYQLLPDLTSDEYEALKADIAARGVMVPVEYDDAGNVLDGHHRIRACQELGIKDWPRIVRVGMTEQEKRLHVRSLNVLRRQLTDEQMQEQRRAMRADGMTYQAIANATGASYGKVYGETSDVQLIKNDKLMGADGKERPPSYASREPQPVGLFNPTIADVARAQEWQALRDDAEPTPGILDPRDVRRQLKELERERKRLENRKLVAQAPDLSNIQPGQTFATITLDPPWDWGDEGDVDQFGRGRPTYATMPLSEIMALPVEDMAQDNAHLYLWITNRSLPKGFGLLEHWGFRYVTMLTWVKPSIGMGNYFRGSTEHVLFGVRGSLALLRRDVGTHFFADRPGRHSAKPPEFYALVESCSPSPWLEMFARTQRPGWATWGAEA